MSTEEIFLSLQKSLYTPFIFFIPKENVPEIAMKMLKSIKKKGVY